MDSSILKQLLTEYDSKRTRELTDLDLRKQKLSETSVEYRNLEKELQELSLSSLKNMLFLSQDEKEKNVKELEKKTLKISKEKEKLLEKLKLPKDYLSPHFECELCGDTGYINNQLCSCIKQKIYDLEYNQANIGDVQKENFDTFDFSLYSDKVEPSYGSSYSPRENMKKIVEISKNFIKNFDSPDEKNLMFCGQTGLGKTFLSNCIAKELLEKNKTVLYQTAPIMLDMIIKSMFENNSTLMDNLLNVDLLIIDDLGTETLSEVKFTKLFNKLLK